MLDYSIRCKECNELLFLDSKATVRDYMFFSDAVTNDAESVIKAIIGKTLMYRCSGCNQLYKYTYKELEKQIINQIKCDLAVFVQRENILGIIEMKHTFFVYCGKCPGFDGSGCCPKELIESCPIKRFPINGL